MFPAGLLNNDDYTSVVNKKHFDRLESYVEDARSKGADIVELNPGGENFSGQPNHKMAPRIVVQPTDDMAVMQDEIFGPILPVKEYAGIEETVGYIADRPRPLALYYFGTDKAERDYILNNTTSGGVTLNDVFFHAAQEDLPFGGIGPSGMGSYHGRDGFEEFSHKKAVYSQTNADVLAVLRPPYGEKFSKLIDGRLKQ